MSIWSTSAQLQTKTCIHKMGFAWKLSIIHYLIGLSIFIQIAPTMFRKTRLCLCNLFWGWDWNESVDKQFSQSHLLIYLEYDAQNQCTSMNANVVVMLTTRILKKRIGAYEFSMTLPECFETISVINWSYTASVFSFYIFIVPYSQHWTSGGICSGRYNAET